MLSKKLSKLPNDDEYESSSEENSSGNYVDVVPVSFSDSLSGCGSQGAISGRSRVASQISLDMKERAAIIEEDYRCSRIVSMGTHHELLELENKEGGPKLLLKAIGRDKFGEFRVEYREALQHYENSDCANSI